MKSRFSSGTYLVEGLGKPFAVETAVRIVMGGPGEAPDAVEREDVSRL